MIEEPSVDMFDDMNKKKNIFKPILDDHNGVSCFEDSIKAEGYECRIIQRYVHEC
jgi:hypothetical protein